MFLYKFLQNNEISSHFFTFKNWIFPVVFPCNITIIFHSLVRIDPISIPVCSLQIISADLGGALFIICDMCGRLFHVHQMSILTHH
ncbi:hypothetical protein GLOIN_2v1702768 [Rhizophagus irregularis DAOM 181602=DAOM 197198]|uniref:Uncharacterized protein n=1 Tax=Rhizophagus irregularis (strain DAOM 181602 / DAOM 197198 / MUCL 43194) TaxID=747089 RepID=A0A2P4P8A6_RHIID|nr:hypothetical protein GLOIN_2v1702768 [Rhizophagus irregularis DAOM 181602=DAOM 197198]POG61614.1 hypothetical protein GLOIN_2v1702768 [Rhizophagus irregularis DAOM 181602=DAOM 197198]GET50425.1 hypothetical protein GLOIN_2v1702768 [Rhizophagus irregularis DAOM 181602=DAOM 197198]|eukprot:XP_025168480.1 hypothetical protein GLOIN_2v1702768 [Rhizophagus irregularis DAOM 181602=DAOM 197198]